MIDRAPEQCTYRRIDIAEMFGSVDSNGTEHLRFENAIALL